MRNSTKSRGQGYKKLAEKTLSYIHIPRWASSYISRSPRCSLAPSPLPEKAPDARAYLMEALDLTALMTDVIVSGEDLKRLPEKEPNL